MAIGNGQSICYPFWVTNDSTKVTGIVLNPLLQSVRVYCWKPSNAYPAIASRDNRPAMQKREVFQSSGFHLLSDLTNHDLTPPRDNAIRICYSLNTKRLIKWKEQSQLWQVTGKNCPPGNSRSTIHRVGLRSRSRVVVGFACAVPLPALRRRDRTRFSGLRRVFPWPLSAYK